MRRKTKQVVSAVFIVGIMFCFYSIYLIIFAMTNEQYACEAQRIVNDSLQTSQPVTDMMEKNQN